MYRELGIVKSFEGNRYNNALVGYDEDLQQWYINNLPVSNQEVNNFYQYIQLFSTPYQSNKGKTLFLVLGILGILLTCFLSVLVGLGNMMSMSMVAANPEEGTTFMITMQTLAFVIPGGLAILFFILYFVSKKK